MSKARRRTETLNADFVDGYAAHWCFGVHEAFRANLDISLDTRVDRAANDALADKLGRRPTAAERITREVWTQGSPPAYAFARGHLLHEPVAAHRLPWAEALPLLRRTILVTDAQPDEGTVTGPAHDGDDDSNGPGRPGATARTTASAPEAVPDVMAADDAVTASASPDTSPATDESTLPAADDGTTGDSAHGGPGWVEFDLLHYDNGTMVRKEAHRLSQQDFVQLLQTGALPAR